MKTLVIAALVVAAVGSPLPDNCDQEASAVLARGYAVPTGPHHGSVSYVAVPTVQHVAVPVLHYQVSHVSSAGPIPTPEVQQATAAFMSAWNTAAARASKIQSTLIKSNSRGNYVVQIPQQVKATEEVQQATAEFMKAWNEAARRATTVQYGISNVHSPTTNTQEVQQATDEFMTAWEAAARKASVIKQAVTFTDAPKPVDHTDEVKKATAEFMAAWKAAAARVPKIQSTMYKVSGTVASPASHQASSTTPVFSPSVEQATAEFMRAWNAAAAAAAAAPDVNIIMGANSHPHKQATSYYSSASYSAPSASVGLQPVQPTPEVQRATAAFMAAWNKAAAQASTIQSTLVKVSHAGHYTVEIPKQVQATEEVKKATAEFMAAWNEAARRAYTVENAISTVSQPVRQTEEVRKATEEFMNAWEAAAHQASTIRQAVTYTGVPQPVDHTDEVKKATAEFMAAWEEAAARVSKIESTMYAISGTVASPAAHQTGFAPQFSPSVEEATAEFMKIWNAAAAAAAAAPDVDIIMGASSLPSASQTAYYQSPASVSYSASASSGVPQPVQPTPEVQRATAAFMAAWNKAADRASRIQSTLVKSSAGGHYVVQVPRQVEATEEVKKATADFMAAWNEAARRATTVESAIYNVPQPVRQTEAVRQATAEFMSAWEAAAQRASAIRQAVTYTGVPQPVDFTDEVKKATAEFMAAWEEAASRVPQIASTIYAISGTVASPVSHHVSGSAPQFTPSVEQATAEFMRAWNAAAAAAAAAPDVNIIMGASSLPQTQATSYQSSVSYSAPATSVDLQPVQPTLEVQRATAAFMAAWNKAAAQASTIHSTLVKGSHAGYYTVEIPKQVQATEEVKKATAEFMAAWNEAARRAYTVESAISTVPQPVRQTEEVRKATEEFMNAWEAAAQQASAISQAVTYTGIPQPVDHTDEVKKATAEFMAAWEEAAARVSKIESTMYAMSGTVASPAAHQTGFAPQFSPSVEEATAEFMKIWNAAAAAAAAAPDVDIIMGASSLPSASQTAYYQSPASVSYSAYASSGVPQPVQPTPEVQRATAAFMAAWNKAADRASKIQSTLVKSSAGGHYVVQVPRQVEATEEVKKATADFMAAWNEAARRATTVESAIYAVPQPVRQTEAVRQATAEFMSAWEDAAQRASAIRQAVTYTGVPQPVDFTDEVKKATAEFMAAWKEAASRVPQIESTIYAISGTVASPVSHQVSGSAPQFTPSVEQATAEFMKAWNAAAAAAAAAPDVDIIMGASSLPQTQATSYQSSVSYSAPATSVDLQPVQPTLEVQRATAAFMAAWNKAAAQASTIHSTLVKGSHAGYYTVEIPKQVQATEEVKKATAEFMAAWNEAARRAYTVENAISTVPQPVQQTEEVRKATEEFMDAWEAAAQQASAISQAVTYTGIPQPVDHTDEVKKATAEFMAAWEEAAARVSKIESTMYAMSGTVASPAAHQTGFAPQFSPSVEEATAEFMKIWNAAAAAAAAAPDVHIIMGASSLPSASQTAYYQSPVSVSYSASASSGVPQPVQPTPEVQRATAAFMAAWNKAADRASRIQSTLVKSSAGGHYVVQVPSQVEATEEVKKATADFMAAWNEAARRATTVESAIYAVPQPVRQTEAVRQATAEFMSAWEAAAQRASAIRQAVTYTGVPQPVDFTDEVKKATAEFMAAWEEAASRVPQIESTIYAISGTVASPVSHQVSGSAPQFTPSVEQATAEFMKAWNAAAAAAAAAPDVNILMGASSQPAASQTASYHSPASVSYTVSASSGVPQPVQPTPEVQRATAAFMAAWNKAADQASRIQSTLVKSSAGGHYVVQVPMQVEATEEVKKATADFMAAWNEAARRATTVESAIYSVPQPVRQTDAVRQATAEFMSAWEAAAQRASAIRQAVTYTGIPQPVDFTDEVKKATAEFMAAWEEAASRVPQIESTIYAISGTVASPGSHHAPGSAPQFTPSVEQATAEFMRAWNAAAAAAAAAPDHNVITGASHSYHSSFSSAHNVASAGSYQSSSQIGAPQAVKPTPEVQQATVAFMAAWNAAAEKANKIHSTLIKSAPTGQKIDIPKQVEETDAVKIATREFMAAWNAAARRGVVVEQAVSSLPQQIEETAEVKKATAEFMSAWHSAAEQASALSSSISPATSQSVTQTSDVQKATADFMAAWNAAAARVPQIETTMYSFSGGNTVSSSKVPVAVVDTPEVVAAREAFMAKFREAEAAALRTSVSRGVLPVPTVLASIPVQPVVYSAGGPQCTCNFDGRVFAPVTGFAHYVKV